MSFLDKILGRQKPKHGNARLRQAIANSVTDRPIQPNPQPPAPAERFHFRENLTAAPGTPVAENRPAPGTAYIQVLNADGGVLASDTIIASPAPKHACVLGYENEIKCTYVVIGETGKAQQEFTAPLGDVPGFPARIPGHLRGKEEVGGTTLRIWWSCEEKDE